MSRKPIPTAEPDVPPQHPLPQSGGSFVILNGQPVPEQTPEAEAPETAAPNPVKEA